MDADGQIKQVSVRTTSGFPLLDEQALRMVARVRIWWIPQRLRKREVNVSVPVCFYIPVRLTTIASTSPLDHRQPFEADWKVFSGTGKLVFLPASSAPECSPYQAV